MVQHVDEARAPAASPPGARGAESRDPAGSRPDRPWLARQWYSLVRWTTATLLSACYGLRATGRQNVPAAGPAILVSNHLSHLDVFVLGLPLNRPLNYVARSTLFFPPLGAFIRSVGGFPIQREGMGAQGLKETLRRLRAGGIVTFFPEGTRSRTGALGPLKPGLAALASRAGVPIVPAAIAGTFEAWPRHRAFPRPHPLHVHYGPPIPPEQAAALTPDQLTALIRTRLLDCQHQARRALPRL